MFFISYPRKLFRFAFHSNSVHYYRVNNKYENHTEADLSLVRIWSQAIALDRLRSYVNSRAIVCDRVRSRSQEYNHVLFLRSVAIECDHLWTKFYDHAIGMCPIMLWFPSVQHCKRHDTMTTNCLSPFIRVWALARWKVKLIRNSSWKK